LLAEREMKKAVCHLAKLFLCFWGSPFREHAALRRNPSAQASLRRKGKLRSQAWVGQASI